MSYVGSLISAQATYTMFHRNGDPCRARINLRILTVERSIPAGFRNQWINKCHRFRDMDRTSVLSQWGENANAGSFFNLPFSYVIKRYIYGVFGGFNGAIIGFPKKDY